MDREYNSSQSPSYYQDQIPRAEGVISSMDLDMRIRERTLIRDNLRVRQQQRIVDEMRQVEASLYALRTRYNECSLISSLPLDIFDRLFTILTWDDPPRNIDSKGKGPKSLGWINVTHVCKHWRNIAIENTALWTEVDSTLGLAWMRAMMSRAGQRPVVFRAKIPYTVDSAFPDILPCLKSGLSRIKDLNLECHGIIFSEFLLSLNSPAPMLSILDLSASLILRDDGAWDTVSEMPTNIFGGSTPNLRKLRVTSVNISWASPILLGLTELSLRYPVSITSAVTHRYSQVLDALDNMPGIEKLDLHNALPPPSPPDIPRKVYLSRLRFLSLKDEITTCHSFYHHFELTADVEVDITVNTFGDDGAEQHVLSLLQEDVTTVKGESVPATVLEFYQSSKNKQTETTLRAFYGQRILDGVGIIESSTGCAIASQYSSQTPSPFPPRTVTLIHIPPQVLVTITNAIFARPTSIALHTLVLHQMRVLNVMPYAHFFGPRLNCRDVESIKVSLPSLRAFLQYLCTSETEPGGQASKSQHLPALRNLIIEGDFSGHVRSSSRKEPALFVHLREALESRRKGAIPLQSLELIDTLGFQRELHLEPLKKLVPDVTYRPCQ